MKAQLRGAALVLILSVLPAACSIGVETRSTPDVRADSVAIVDAARAFSRAYVEGDTITLASLYTSDALLLPANRDVRGNRSGARWFYSPPGRRPADHFLHAETIEIEGDVAIDVGHWNQVSARGDTATGRYLVVWRRGDDERWRMAYDMWHPPVPPAPAAPTAAEQRLRGIARAASADRIAADLATLTNFGTRHTLSDTLSATRGIGAARRWVHAELSRISATCGGCIDVEFHSTMVGGTQRIPDSVAVVNVLGFQRGTTDPNRFIVISGHLDSRASDVMDAEIDAPGAVDDASGVAAVLEAARLLSGQRFAATILYVAVSGEEQGLLGAAALADRAAREGWFVEAMLNNDVVGNVQGQDGVVDSLSVRVFSEGVRATETPGMARARRATGGEADSPARQLARYVAEMGRVALPELRVLTVQRLDRFGRGGDHSAFAARGFPAVRFTETHEDYRRQHQDIRVEDGVEYGDVLDEAEPAYTARVAGLNAAVIAALAWAPPPPDSVQVRGAVQPSTTLSWRPIDRSRAPDLSGYVVRWRETTSPVWQHEVFVGDTTAHTLENVVVDNWFFGVASVSRDGYESPTVFAGPVGAWAPSEDAETRR